MRLCFVIDECMKTALTKDEFIAAMEAQGYGVIWTDERKYITYIVPGAEGKNTRRVRDIKLHEEKYLKENMENEFRIRQGEARRFEGDECPEERDGNGNDTEGRLGYDSKDSYAHGDDRIRDARDNEDVHDRDGSQGERAHGMGDRESETDNREHRKTGWESERSSCYGNKKQNRQRGKNVVGEARASGSASDNSATLRSLTRLGAHAGNIVADSDETEEERKIREGDNAGVAVGLAIAGTEKILTALIKEETLPENDDIDEGEDEGEHAFRQSM